MRRLFWWLTIVLLAVGVPVMAAAQTGGTLQGRVLDDQGLALPGATVTMTNVETGLNRVIITDTEGWYRAPGAAAGRLRDPRRVERLRHRDSRPRAADDWPGAHRQHDTEGRHAPETVTVTRGAAHRDDQQHAGHDHQPRAARFAAGARAHVHRARPDRARRHRRGRRRCQRRRPVVAQQLVPHRRCQQRQQHPGQPARRPLASKRSASTSSSPISSRPSTAMRPVRSSAW